MSEDEKLFPSRSKDTEKGIVVMKGFNLQGVNLGGLFVFAVGIYWLSNTMFWLPELTDLEKATKSGQLWISLLLVFLGSCIVGYEKMDWGLRDYFNTPLKIQVLLRGVGSEERNFKAWVYVNRRTGECTSPDDESKELQLIEVDKNELKFSHLLGAPRWVPELEKKRVYMLGTYYQFPN